MKELIIDTDSYYQYSRGRNTPIVIYEYLGKGEVEKIHEGYIDDCIGYLKSIIDDISVIWTDCNEMITNSLIGYLNRDNESVREKIITSNSAYSYIRESQFRKRFVSYWIETKPEKY